MTRRDWENRVLQMVRERGGFSVFTVTENQFLAHAADRLEQRGEIVRTGGRYPWCAYSAKGK